MLLAFVSIPVLRFCPRPCMPCRRCIEKLLKNSVFRFAWWQLGRIDSVDLITRSQRNARIMDCQLQLDHGVPLLFLESLVLSMLKIVKAYRSKATCTILSCIYEEESLCLVFVNQLIIQGPTTYKHNPSCHSISTSLKYVDVQLNILR